VTSPVSKILYFAARVGLIRLVKCALEFLGRIVAKVPLGRMGLGLGLGFVLAAFRQLIRFISMCV